VLRAADMTNSKTYKAEHNKSSIQALLTQFREGRMRLVEQLERMSEEEVSRSALHPRLQKQMRVIDLAVFMAEHDDHHLASIRRQAHDLSSKSKVQRADFEASTLNSGKDYDQRDARTRNSGLAAQGLV